MLDAASLEASLAPDEAALTGIAAAQARAEALGLGLLAARIRRRRVGALLALGHMEEAAAQRLAAVAFARSEGIGEELERLERLGAG